MDDNVKRVEEVANSFLSLLNSDSRISDFDLYDLKVLSDFFVRNKRISMSSKFNELFDRVMLLENEIETNIKNLDNYSAITLLNVGKLYAILYPYSEVKEASCNSDFVFEHYAIFSDLNTLRGFSIKDLSKRCKLSEEDIFQILLSGIKRELVLKYANGTYGLTKKGCNACSFVIRNKSLFELCKGSVN